MMRMTRNPKGILRSFKSSEMSLFNVNFNDAIHVFGSIVCAVVTTSLAGTKTHDRMAETSEPHERTDPIRCAGTGCYRLEMIYVVWPSENAIVKNENSHNLRVTSRRRRPDTDTHHKTFQLDAYALRNIKRIRFCFSFLHHF